MIQETVTTMERYWIVFSGKPPRSEVEREVTQISGKLSKNTERVKKKNSDTI
jgi:hypothetical protein